MVYRIPKMEKKGEFGEKKIPTSNLDVGFYTMAKVGPTPYQQGCSCAILGAVSLVGQFSASQDATTHIECEYTSLRILLPMAGGESAPTSWISAKM